MQPGLTLWLDSTVVGAEVEVGADGRRTIRSVRVVRNFTEEVFVVTAKFFADCTGDGRLGAEAGADFHIGREGRADYGEPLARDAADRQTLGSSILLTGRRHETPQAFRAPAWARKFQKSDFRHREIGSFEYGYWWFEWGGHLDTIRDNETIRHELLRIALGVWDWIKNSGEHPDSANWALDWVGSIPGKRESRRFLGPKVLTQHDVEGATIFPDAVAYGGWWIDTHPPLGVDAPDEPPCVQHHFPHLYTLPLRCHHSRNVANLFFAGRNISATHIAFASTRVMATCAVGGQAVGTAAALWKDGAVSDIAALSTPANIHALQQTLLRDDAWIPSLTNRDPSDLARSARVTASSHLAGAGPENVIDGVARDERADFGPWAADTVHAWESDGLPASITLTWSAPVAIREVRITFDSGFARELMLSASDAHSNRLVRGPQPEVVRHFRLLAGDRVLAEECDNHRRHRIIRIGSPVTTESLTLECAATHGHPNARVFEIRACA
jgi:hypothetical protein